MPQEKAIKTIDPYIMLNIIDKETLEATDHKCPSCNNIGSLKTTDSFLKESKLYHGVKYNCIDCDDSFIAIDSSCLLPEVDDEIKESGLIRVEFSYDEILEMIEREDEFWKNN